MSATQLNTDEILRSLAAEAVKQKGHIRAAVCDLTLKAIQSRDEGFAQVGKVIKPIVEGVKRRWEAISIRTRRSQVPSPALMRRC